MVAKIELIKGDITKLKVDAVVNAANETLLGGGGVDGAIHSAAGPELLAECRNLGSCKTGQAKITKGYKLLSKYIIHTVGPVWEGGKSREAELLALCYRNSLNLAKEYSLRSIAFPSISTGAYGFPIQKAAAIALITVKNFLKENPNVFEKVIFVLFSEQDFEIYNNLIKE
ncbi:MAG: O-acetyl-ADP-ribose deacetylase [Candidatus Omnitrophica bacterium]|nr:O-acetyl-ADP-ribose deacetylase [Candidatus Omnitrophota bacterium]